MSKLALYAGIFQEVWPNATCYGCGPSNPDGLHIHSQWSEDGQFVIATHYPDAKHNGGFDDLMYGGLIASLIDCHSIWTAIAWIYRSENRPLGSAPIVTCVTGELNVKYLKPTPLRHPVQMKSWIEGEVGRKTRVLTEFSADGIITVRGDVMAVRIDADKSLGAKG